MSSYDNFQSDNVKFSSNRTDFYNPDFDTPIIGDIGDLINSQNEHKWAELISWLRWYPDIAYDLITPKEGKKLILDNDQRVALRCLVRFPENYMCVIRGYGKCVAGDTLIRTDKGLIEIGEYFNYSKPITEEEKIHDVNVVDRYGSIEKSTAGISSGHKDTVILKTDDGYDIEPSLNHPLLVMSKNGNLEWKKSEDIENGDYLCISREDGIFGSDVNINVDMDSYLDKLSNNIKSQVIRGKFKNGIPKTLDKDLSYIIGVLLREGGLTSDKQIYFTNIDEEIINKVIKYFEEVLGKKVIKQGKSCLVSGMYNREFFKQLGLDYSSTSDRKIPNIVMKSNKENVSSLLRGLFDADGVVEDGNAISYSTDSEKMSKQVQQLLLCFGIISKRGYKVNKKTKIGYYTIRIMSKNIDIFAKEIGFTSIKKLEKMENTIKRTNRGNANIDIIPFQRDRISNLDISKEVRQKMQTVISQGCELNYDKLHFLLNNIDDEYLRELLELNYFYSKVVSKENSSNWVYDIHVPSTNSFIGNGFINHNTMLHIMAQYHIARFFPAIALSITASTKESAVGIWKEKHDELLEYFPALADEMKEASFQKDRGYVKWVNDSWMDALANSKQSNGKRRRRGGLEESNIIDKEVLQSSVLPIFNIPRRTLGNLIDPEELNGQINRYTTSGYKNSDEFEIIKSVYQRMINLEGGFLVGSDWRLPVYFGRQKISIVNLAREGGLTAFKQNYLCEWVGSVRNSLINITKLLNCRTIVKFELEIPKDKRGNNMLYEYVIGVDVARSASESNNQTALAALRLGRNLKGKIETLDLVNIETPSNGLNYEEQALVVKKFFVRYGGTWDLATTRVKAVVIDANTIGQGLVEKLLEHTTDIDTGDIYPSFSTINTDEKFEGNEAIEMVYSFKSTGINSEVITKFIDVVESRRLRIYKSWNDLKPDTPRFTEEETDNEIACEQTQRFIDQVANLKLVALSGGSGKNTVVQVVKKVDKDIYAAFAYAVYYIALFLDEEVSESDYEYVIRTKTN